MILSYSNSQTISRQQELFLVLVLFLLLAQGQAAGTEAETSFQQGRHYYAHKDYESAIEAFSAAARLAPGTSTYHHWLGKSYGRLAQNSSLFRAYRLSGRTREEFERAVALDDKNIDAISDLMEFYLEAPAFLGGGRDKADRLRQRLEELKKQNLSSDANLTAPELSN